MRSDIGVIVPSGQACALAGFPGLSECVDLTLLVTIPSHVVAYCGKCRRLYGPTLCACVGHMDEDWLSRVSWAHPRGEY